MGTPWQCQIDSCSIMLGNSNWERLPNRSFATFDNLWLSAWGVGKVWRYFKRGSLFNVTGWVWPVISWNKQGLNQVLFTLIMLRCCLSPQEVSWDFLLCKKKKAPHLFEPQNFRFPLLADL